MKIRYWLLLGLAAATLSFAAIDTADARRGGGFRGSGGGIKMRGGHFRSFKPMRFNKGFARGHKIGGQKFGRSSYGRSWTGKSHGKYGSHNPYRYSGKHGSGHGKHGWKKGDHGHTWKKDYGKHHKARHYGHKGGHGHQDRGHSWKGRDHGQSYGRKKFFIDRGSRSHASASVNVFAGGGSGSSIDISSIVYAIASFAAENPDAHDYSDYPDSKTGVVVRYDSKECDCGADVEKIYAWIRQSCEKQGKVWDKKADTIEEACRFPDAPPLK